jgi:hypothetical protein
MPVNLDFSDLFCALNAAEARYLVVGGYAFSYHAEPRYTKDLDVWVEPTSVNAAAVWKALVSFGAPMSELTVEDLSRPAMVIQLGVEPNRIDLVTSIDGVAFEDGWRGRVESTYGDAAIHVIGRRELIRNKIASGRPQDVADVARLNRDA